MATSTIGAAKDPNRLLSEFCMMPMLAPRFSGLTSSTTSDCEIGPIPPSDMPMIRRAAISIRNEPAMPESTEHTEKTRTEPIRNDLRLLKASASPPNRKPDKAQVKESAEMIMPTWVSVRLRSCLMPTGQR